MNPRVSKVEALENHRLKLVFENGEIKIFDVSPYLEFGIFNELKDENFFKLVKPFMGSVKWPHNQDFCPDTLYEESF